MTGLIDYLASGDRSPYVVFTLRDLETFANQEREAIRCAVLRWCDASGEESSGRPGSMAISRITRSLGAASSTC